MAAGVFGESAMGAGEALAKTLASASCCPTCRAIDTKEYDLATLGMSPAEKQAVEDFRRDVVEPSMTSLVIIDFWAE